MNEKEVAEIRRRFKPEKSAVTHVRGCYVSAQGEVVSHFDQSLALMPQEEGENLMNLLRKTLSGGLGRNLLNLSFSTAQVVDSPEHKLLMALRDSQLQDQGAVEAFFQQVAASFRLEDIGYLILLAYDSYDVPYRGKDGGSLEDASETVYSYILCSLCPVKETKPVLSYRVPENLFRNREVDWVIAPPEAGFLFPAFDDRCANLYEALYYTKNTGESHQELVDTLFRQELPPPADVQKETFQSLLTETLGEDCSLDVVQSVQSRLVGMMAQHKEDKDPEPLVLSKGALDMVLSTSGVEEETGRHVVWGYNRETGAHFTIPYQFIQVHFPGTGDMFSAVLVGELLAGRGLEPAVRRAMDVLETLIRLERDEAEKNKGIRIEKYLSVLNQ